MILPPQTRPMNSELHGLTTKCMDKIKQTNRNCNQIGKTHNNDMTDDSQLLNLGLKPNSIKNQIVDICEKMHKGVKTWPY